MATNIELSIMPECYIDTKLIKILVPPKERYNHQKGCTTITNLMQKQLKDSFAVGIVDRDKKELAYAKEFDLLCEVPQSLQLYRHKNLQKHHYLIFIIPAMEKWILENSLSANLQIVDFGLPNTLNELRAITKTAKSEENNQYATHFNQLFQTLKIANPLSIAVLSFWLTELKSKNYTIDLQELKAKTEKIMENM
jgi:hypothetical protein